MTQSRFSRPLNHQAREEASEWLVAFCEDELDASGREAFNIWLRASPEHVRACLRVFALWEDDDLFARNRKLDADALVRRAMAESNVVAMAEPESSQSQPRQEPASPAVRRFAIALPLAAALAGIALLGWFHWAPKVYSTAAGEQRTITLPDGSTVALNARSKIAVKYDDSQRRIDLLEGQALFRVAKDAARTFVVRSADTRIRALGTQFDVYRKPDKTVVTVLEGRVAVSAAQRRVSQLSPAAPSGAVPDTLLSAGEQLIATPQALIATKPGDVTAATAWVDGKLVFKSTPLGEVIEEFNRHLPRRLVVDDEQLREVRISGIFSFSDSAQFIEFLSLRFALTVRESEEEVRIARR